MDSVSSLFAGASRVFTRISFLVPAAGPRCTLPGAGLPMSKAENPVSGTRLNGHWFTIS